jgi:copper transport protein
MRGLAWAARALAGLAVALVCLLVPASPASAHASLSASSPAAGSVVQDEPAEVTLTFTEPVNVGLGRVVVVDPSGKNAQAGKPSRRSGGTVVAVKLKPGLPRGTYVVSYRVVSADGHPISGGISFSIGAASKSTGADTAASEEAPVDHLVRGVLYLGKFAGFAGIALLAGAVLILLELWPRRISLAGPGRIAWIGWGLLGAATVTSLFAQVPYVTGGGFGELTWLAFGDSVTSPVGVAQVLRVGILLAAIPLLLRVTLGKALGRADQALLAGFFAALLLTWPFAGHASASAARLISIPADAVHVGAMAIWIGGLVVLARYLLPSAKLSEAALILPV